MIKFELLKDAGLLIVEPRDALTAEDFRMVSRTVDPLYCREWKTDRTTHRCTVFPRLGELWRTRRAYEVRP